MFDELRAPAENALKPPWPLLACCWLDAEAVGFGAVRDQWSRQLLLERLEARNLAVLPFELRGAAAAIYRCEQHSR